MSFTAYQSGIAGDYADNQQDFQIRDMVLNDEILDFGELKINPLKRNVEKNGEEIHWVFSKAQIYRQIWKEPYYQAYHNAG